MTFHFPSLKHLSWPPKVFLFFLGTNILLIIFGGVFIAPSTLSSLEGWGDLLAPIGMQVILGLLALIGPLAFAHYARSMGIALALGVLFAVAYIGLLSFEIAGIQLSFDTGPITVYCIFVIISLCTGILTSLRSRRIIEAVVAGFWALIIGTALWSLGLMVINYVIWGRSPWYQFWAGDGALDDFRQSGSTNLPAFLLQDLQGAIFWHPILSAVLGVAGGFAGYGIGRMLAQLQRLFPSRSATSG
jgi:hypothetical protein